MDSRIKGVWLSIDSVAAQAALPTLVVLKILAEHPANLGLDGKLAIHPILLLLGDVRCEIVQIVLPLRWGNA